MQLWNTLVIFMQQWSYSALYDYFVTYAQSPITYHWFEAGPVKMAEKINTSDGDGMGWEANIERH